MFLPLRHTMHKCILFAIKRKPQSLPSNYETNKWLVTGRKDLAIKEGQEVQNYQFLNCILISSNSRWFETLCCPLKMSTNDQYFTLPFGYNKDLPLSSNLNRKQQIPSPTRTWRQTDIRETGISSPILNARMNFGI